MSIELDLGFKSYEYETAFRGYIRDKSVAIISTAPYLEELELGDKIDECDIVVRVHHVHGATWDNDINCKEFVPAKMQKHIGSRTEIYYFSWMSREDPGIEALVRRSIDLFMEAGGRFWCHDHHFTLENRIWELVQRHDHIWMRTMPTDDYRALYAMLDSNPIGGTRVIGDIVSKSPKSLLLVGFPCWVSKDYPNGVFKTGSVGQSSKPKRDFNWIRSLYRSHDVSVDPVMDHLFAIIPEDAGDPSLIMDDKPLPRYLKDYELSWLKYQ